MPSPSVPTLPELFTSLRPQQSGPGEGLAAVLLRAPLTNYETPVWLFSGTVWVKYLAPTEASMDAAAGYDLAPGLLALGLPSEREVLFNRSARHSVAFTVASQVGAEPHHALYAGSVAGLPAHLYVCAPVLADQALESLRRHKIPDLRKVVTQSTLPTEGSGW